MEFFIAAPQPFSFEHNLNYMARSENECLYHVEAGKLRKLIPAGGGQVLAEISGDEDGLLVRVLSTLGASCEVDQLAIAAHIREWFDLDRDLGGFYEMAQEDRLLRDVAERFQGLRLVGVPDLFEAMCWAIIGQQINLTFAYTLKRRFVETFGRSIEFEGRVYWTFPTPQDIAGLSVSELTPLQMTSKKSEYLIGVARLMNDGDLDKMKLLELADVHQMEKFLTRIRGIGPWTAHYVLMRCLRAPSAFPIADVGLHNAIKHELGLEEKPSIEEIRNLSKGWSGWEAYATFYLWRSLY